MSLNPGEQIELTEDIDISSINSVTVADVTVNIMKILNRIITDTNYFRAWTFHESRYL